MGICRECGGSDLKVVWTWARYSDNTIGYNDSEVDYSRFVSRSTKYRCIKCGRSFVYYAKSYPHSEEQDQGSMYLLKEERV